MAAISSYRTIPCKFCKKKFASKQALDAHLRVHMLNHKKRQNLSQQARTRRNVLAKAIGMCQCCMQTSPLGNYFTSMIEQAYLLRFLQLAQFKQLGPRNYMHEGSSSASDPLASSWGHGPEMADSPMAAPVAGEEEEELD